MEPSCNYANEWESCFGQAAQASSGLMVCEGHWAEVHDGEIPYPAGTEQE